MVRLFSGIVLAGGKSLRMGVDKRRVMLSGMNLLGLSLRRLEGIVEEVLVVLGDRGDFELGDARIVLDIERGRGPLCGLYTGLLEMRNSYGLVTPVDNPLLPSKFLTYMKENAFGYDAVVPRWSRGVEPLAGVYSKGLLPAMREWMEGEGDPAPSRFLKAPGLRVRFITEEEISRFGEPEILFLNINTERDLEKAERIIKEGREP